MKKTYSLGNRILALTLSVIMVLSMLPSGVFAQETAVAKIGDVTYASLAEAIAAVPTGANQTAPTEATTVMLLQSTAYSFDVGVSTGSTTMNLVLDLNGNTLTLAPSVGSVNTKSNGIRVLAYSKLEVKNGTILCSSAAEDNVKVGIANYGILTLTDMTVESGDLTIYTINNRGALTLNGKTTIESGSTCAITNDPYDLYYTTDVNASVTCDSSDVVVESMLVERYARTSNNNGGVELNISAGYFGKIIEDGNTAVSTSYDVTGGTIGVSTTEELELALNMAKAGAEYACPQNPVTIQLQNDLAGSFDVGISTGKAPKNILLDLNTHTLTLKPGVGSFNTKSNGIRVLAHSKLEIVNGTIICSSEEADNVKVGIANYSDLVLDSVTVQSGDLTIYTINNRGNLTLKGITSVENGKVAQTDYTDSEEYIAITNDPYNLYYATPINAQINCADSGVLVGNVQLETYGSKGDIELNISAGTFGAVAQPAANGTVTVKGAISGGSYASDVTAYCTEGYKIVVENGMSVVKAEQTDFGFANEEYTVSFGASDNVFTATVNNAQGTVTYSTVWEKDTAGENANIVEIDEVTGRLTILAAGTVQVKAVAAGNAQYDQAEDTYTLVIEPVFGTVHSFSGGTVANEDPADTVVSINEATLEWVAKDESIGRNQDGWWVGIKIVAPEGIDLTKVVFQRKTGADSWTEKMAFVPDNADGRHVELWGLITAEYLKSFSDAGKKMNYVWRFSWDGDGVYEQTVTITIEPTGITLNQAGFAFDRDEDATTYGASYTAAEPSGGQGSKVIYSVENVSDSAEAIAVIDPETGKLTINKAGAVKITATKSGDFYNDISDSYILIINHAAQTGFTFAKDQVVVTYNEKDNLYIQTVGEGQGKGDVTYTIVSQKYNGEEVTDVVTIDEKTGKLTINQSGVIVVQANKTGDECYLAAAPAEYTLTVNKAEQTGFVFAQNKVAVTYNNNNFYTQTVGEGQGSGEVTYTIISQKYNGQDVTDVAIIDENTGELTINQSGVIVVQANKAEDNRYLAATPAEYTLTINKAEHDISFAEPTVNLTYGELEYIQVLTVGALAGEDAEVTYALSGDTAIAKDFDTSTGKITFADKQVGTVTVTATKAEDECYKETPASYTLAIDYLAQQTPTVTGDKLIAGSVWYTGNVKINAPDGYLIARSNVLTGTVWEESISFTTEGADLSDTVYLIDENGHITDAITVSGIYLDTVKPTCPVITVNGPSWVEKAFELLSFGFFKAPVTVTITSSDNTSSVQSITYSYSGTTGEYSPETITGGEQNVTVDANNSITFTLPDAFKGTVKATAQDVAGHTSEEQTQSTDENGKLLDGVVVDFVAPDVSITYEGSLQATVKELDNGEVFRQDVAPGAEARLVYNSAVTATITVEEINFYEEDITVKVTRDGVDVTELVISGWNNELNTAKFSKKINMDADGNYIIEVEYSDSSTNEMDWDSNEYTDKSGKSSYTSNVITVDKVKPKVSVDFADDDTVINGKYFDHYRNATVTIEDRNFRPNEVELDIEATDVNGEIVEVYTYSDLRSWNDWTDKGNDTWEATISFNVDANYQMNFTYEDIANYKIENDYSANFVVDTNDPILQKISYSENTLDKILAGITFGYYEAEKTVTLSATDLTAGAEYFTLTVTQQGSSNATTLELPENLVISAVDGEVISGDKGFIDAITIEKEKGTVEISFKVPAQFRGDFSFQTTDMARNTANGTNSSTTLIVDDLAPEISISYSVDNTGTKVQFLDASNTTVDSFNEAVNALYNGNVTANIVINDANFFEGTSAENGIIHHVGIKLTKTDEDGNKTVIEYLPEGATQKYATANTEDIAWTTEGDVHTLAIPYNENADYVLEIEYTDLSSNESDITANDGQSATKTYVSKIVTVDKESPVISVSYDNYAALNTNNYKENRTATITIVEHNFRADDVAAAVTAVDVQGNPVEIRNYAEYLSKRENWKYWDKDGNLVSEAANAVNPNEHIAQITYSTDAAYTFDIDYTDLAKNEAADHAKETFVVDHKASTGLTISYSESLVEKIIGAVTFGYYQPKVTVTLTADDITSGVDYFDWTYTKESGSSDANTDSYGGHFATDEITYSNKGKTATVSFTIDAQARGHISATVTDKAGNVTSKSDDKRILVVDQLAPEISISYTADSADTKVQFLDASNANVDAFDKASNALYNGNVTAKIVINEANFFESVSAKDGMIHQVGIRLIKTDDNENVTVYEYLPEGAAQKYPETTPVYITWVTEGDTYTVSIPYTDNADYVLDVEYTDLSSNAAVIDANDGAADVKASYRSKVVTVDKVAPVVSVDYGNKTVINTLEDRDYFNAKQTAVITVQEHNFRASDFIADVTAQNVLGESVVVENFRAKLADGSKWSRTGNVYTIAIEYSVDANYTFDFTYEDLARNAAVDYAQDLFTVDTTVPTDLTVSYSTNVFQEILEDITFGYYNAKMTVTVTATDITSGIYHFASSYINNEGVSQVNAQLLDQAILAAQITYNGATATASFEIPKMVLGVDNQFNGTVHFTAYDRGENNTDMADDTHIIVDNISPTATITYNAPINDTGSIAYYDGNIYATISINEANFDAEDVVVTVTKDGAAYPAQVAWTDETVDNHVGTFTLTADGDYTVAVQYSDKSGNQMADYISNQLTLDTQAPVITVSDIVANSANNAEQYGFTIQITDINLNAQTLAPILSAVMQGEDGLYTTQNIDLGEAEAVTVGKRYTFTVENLTEDALYTLSASAADMSGNAVAQILLEDEQSYETVQFSVNRNGSTFGFGDSATEMLVNNYYVYSVDNDVMIVEVNVDPVETYTVSVNGSTLTEGTDYTSVQTSRDGEWSIRTYTINKALFAEEGEYSVIVSSTDKTQTTAFSDIKKLTVAFVVDQTAPVLTITGLQAGGRYQTDLQTVTIIPTDEGGRLNSLSIVVLDSDGNQLRAEDGSDISLRFEMSGEELLTYLSSNDGKVTFTVPEGLENQVRIICNDSAVNGEMVTNTYSQTFERVTVSQSGLIIFYANKPLFYGTIGAVVAVVILVILLIKRKSDKKKKEKAKA